ncbi:MAG: ATP-binding cassette domain-containing protein [Chloroherpetonaceae bacterium]|nr:ATP-binding cassette domain-containing protein [Chloroherpetonaceae bacterium]MCS7210377.1 ATP-binding cassette domain-containing protein [Chloroherpetonaceae bacterium]MDW8018945.1 ATP-binding cassette domain-containing protein [Chloroherpetonaceae bacterium]
MIEFRNVSLRYGSREILKNISLTFEDRTIHMILGPSGVGKSTILKLMLGLIKPTSGEIYVDGMEISRLTETQLFPIRRKMGVVFQGNALFDSLTVSENLGFFLRENLNLPEEEVQRRIKEQIKFAGLEGYENALPENLSGGMKKRVAIGRALIFHPEFILLDEPTAGLDPISSKKILDFIKRLKEEIGLGAVMVTHIITDVFGVADMVSVLYGGEIIYTGPPEKMSEVSHPFITSFLSNAEV